jgi:hypothetical protein
MRASRSYKCILWGLAAVAASGQQTISCPLAEAKSGDTVVLRGEVFAAGHDVFVRPVGCEERVILVYGDDPSLEKSRISVRRDETFKQYEGYLKAEWTPAGITDCRHCPRYRVTAEFRGRLDITDSAGWKKDPKSGKVIGVEGFGHPVPFTRYRLVIASISKVEAVERTPEPIP